MGTSRNLGFSSRLMSTIAECHEKVEVWVENEKQRANQMEQEYQQTLSQEQSTIDKLEEDLLAVKFKLGINIKENTTVEDDDASSEGGIAQRQQALLREKELLQDEIARLKQERDDKAARIKGLEQEAEREQARAAEVRSKKVLAEESKNTTVDDLTRGIVNYKYLGLDFEKAENQTLRFSFSQIDPDEPTRKFSFVLGATDSEIYELEDCSPSLDQELLMTLLRDLNDDDDLGQFIMKMRTAFIQSLVDVEAA